MRPDMKCALLCYLGLSLSAAGCSRPQTTGAGGLDGPVDEAASATLFIDWDDHDFHLDRYLQINLRDLVAGLDRDRRDPVEAYRQAVTYEGVWDSIGLALFQRLNAAETAERQELAARHHRQARSLLLGVIHHHRNRLEQGLLPDFQLRGMIDRHEGVETVVTTALKHLTTATGTDPSRPAAWRDLAYFSGVVGDRLRQQKALNAALAALDLIDPRQAAEGDHARLRRDLLLDLAWLAREQGQPDLVMATLDHLEPWLETLSPERNLRLYEARILRGLGLADRGDRRAAIEVANELTPLTLHVRAIRALKREGLQWHIGRPHRGKLGFMRAAWPRRDSQFGRHWIRAAVGASSGDPRHTARLLHAPPTDLDLPARLASRYWQDRGRLHAAAGDLYASSRCYQWAAYYRPYQAFFPLRVSSGPTRLGELGEIRRYYAGYGLFFLCGDLDLFQADHGASMAGQMTGRR